MAEEDARDVSAARFVATTHSCALLRPQPGAWLFSSALTTWSLESTVILPVHSPRWSHRHNFPAATYFCKCVHMSVVNYFWSTFFSFGVTDFLGHLRKLSESMVLIVNSLIAISVFLQFKQLVMYFYRTMQLNFKLCFLFIPLNPLEKYVENTTFQRNLLYIVRTKNATNDHQGCTFFSNCTEMSLVDTRIRFNP